MGLLERPGPEETLAMAVVSSGSRRKTDMRLWSLRHRCNLLVKLPHSQATQCISADVPFVSALVDERQQPVFERHNSSQALLGDTQQPKKISAEHQAPKKRSLPSDPCEENNSVLCRIPQQSSLHFECRWSRWNCKKTVLTPDVNFLRDLVRERFGIPTDLQRLLVNGRPAELLSVTEHSPAYCTTILSHDAQADEQVPLFESVDTSSCGRALFESLPKPEEEANSSSITGGFSQHNVSFPSNSNLACHWSEGQLFDGEQQQLLPPFLNVTVLLRLRGGKGGFGANLRAVKGRRKKTTNNLDACRDLSGRRLRHAQAVERVKEWLVKKRQEDELVKRLTDGAEQLSLSEQRDPDPSVSLDKGYVKQIRSRAAQLTRSVREGVRQDQRREEELDALEAKAKVKTISTKQLMSSRSWFLHNSALSDDEGESGDEPMHDEEEKEEVKEPAPRRPRFLKTVIHPLQSKKPALLTPHVPATKHEPVDQKPQISSSFWSTASTSGSCRSSSPDCESSTSESQETPASSATAAASFANAAASSVDAAGPFGSATASSESGSKRGLPSRLTQEEQNEIEGEAKKLDISTYSSVEELEKVNAEVLKAKLRMLGMKCGGRPSERAARLFLLKSHCLENLPANVMAK